MLRWVPWEFLLYVGVWFLLAFVCGYAFYRLQLLEKPRLNNFLDRRGVALALLVVWVLMLFPGLLLLTSGPAAHATDTKRGAAAHAGFPLPWAAQGPLPHLDRHWVRDTEGGFYRPVSESAAIMPWMLAIDGLAMTAGALATVSLSRGAVARARRRRGGTSVVFRLRALRHDLRAPRRHMPGLRLAVAFAAMVALVYALRLLSLLGTASATGWG